MADASTPTSAAPGAQACSFTRPLRVQQRGFPIALRECSHVSSRNRSLWSSRRAFLLPLVLVAGIIGARRGGGRVALLDSRRLAACPLALTALSRRTVHHPRRARGDDEDGEVILFTFDDPHGGPLSDAVERWYSQFTQPTADRRLGGGRRTTRKVATSTSRSSNSSGTSIRRMGPMHTVPTWLSPARGAVVAGPEGRRYWQAVGPSEDDRAPAKRDSTRPSTRSTSTLTPRHGARDARPVARDVARAHLARTWIVRVGSRLWRALDEPHAEQGLQELERELALRVVGRDVEPVAHDGERRRARASTGSRGSSESEATPERT